MWAAHHPLKREAVRVTEKMKKAGIRLKVLDRYGIENYFSRKALETVLKRDIAADWPIPDDVAVVGRLNGYSKNMNADTAAAMELSDLAGTDLGAFLNALARIH